jgi:Multimeric flavodoxin WrbA
MPYFCCGCYNCLKGSEHCPHYGSLRPITQSMDEADLLVFTTPVYCLRTTGSMKALLDHCFIHWVSHRPKERMYFKKAVVIAIGSGIGMKKAADDIKTSLSYWGISDIQTYRQRSLSTSWEGVKEEIKAKTERDISMLAAKIKRRSNTVKVSLGRKLMFFAMRSMQIKGWGACPQDKAYWEEKGWLGKMRPWKTC